MIQFTKEFSKQLKREQERLDRIEKCLSYLRICYEPAMTPSGYITYAVVNSTTVGGRRYIVDIDESGDVPTPTHCNCDATVENCIHRQAVTVYYQRIAAIFAHDEQEEVVEPVVERPAGIEVNALLLKNRELYLAGKLTEQCGHQDDGLDVAIHQYINVYEIEGPMKKVSHAYGCCGHVVHLGDAGELCGPCRCK